MGIDISSSIPSSVAAAQLSANSSQTAKSNEAAELEKQQQVQVQQNAAPKTDQDPQISTAGARLSAASNSTETDNNSASITNSKEAQQVLNQIRSQMQANPTQAMQAQGSVSKDLVSSVA